MSELLGSVLELGFGEVVHVELSDERAQLVVLEVPWKHLSLEGFDVFNPEAFAVLGPADDVEKLLVLGKLESLVLTCRIPKVFVRKPGTEAILVILWACGKSELDISLFFFDFIIRNAERSKKTVKRSQKV